MSSGISYQAITDTVANIIWTNDEKGSANFFNQRWYEFSGRSYEESQGLGWQAIVNDADRSAVDEWQKALKEKRYFESEARLRRADGTFEWYLLQNIPMRGKTGEIYSWFGSATNIQKQKTIEENLKQTTARLDAILDAAVDFAIITFDVHGRITGWNRGAVHLFGYTEEEALNQSGDIIFTQQDKKTGIPMQELKIARERGCCEDERWHLRKDGSRFFMSGVTTPVIENEVIGYVKVTRNITKRKLVEEALVLADQENLIALQSTNWGEWEYDLAHDKVVMSREGLSILGLTENHNSFHSSFFLTLLQPDDIKNFRNELQKCLSGLNIFHHICRIFRPGSHEEAWINMYGRVIAEENGTPLKMRGVIHDVSIRKFVEQQKESFIGVVSHELKTPVTSIKLYTQVLEEQFEAADDENGAILKKLHTQVDNLTDLIYTLLDFSAVSSGNIPLQPEDCNLNELVKETISELQLSFPRHELVFNPGVISLVRADKKRIKQVLANLVTNAVKYSPNGKEVIISSHDRGDGALVQVQDFGIGITAEDRKKVFNMFYRGIESKTKGFSGFGIGLYISSKIIRQHHGDIGVDSVHGQGSTFYFKLPYV